MHATLLDFLYALRMLRRKPAFAAVAVAALALGIGANTAVFTVVNGVLLHRLPFPESDRLFLLSYAPKDWPFESGGGLFERHYLEFRSQDHMFESLATFATSSVSLTGAGEPARVTAAKVTADFFSVLRVRAARGRTFAPGEDQAGQDGEVVLSDHLWRSRFGADPKVLGRTVTLDGVARQVIGVMPPSMNFPNHEDLWMPLVIRIDPHTSSVWAVIGRLKAGALERQARAELETIAPRLKMFFDIKSSDLRAQLLPLRELVVAGARTSLWIFAGAVGLVLLIACANVANLFLTRAIGRRSEIGMRSALGAGRWRLIRLLLTESTLVALVGGAAGFLLALWGVPALLAIAPDGTIPRADEIHPDGVALAFTIGVSLLTGIGFGLAPALQATRRELRDSLGQSSRTFTGRHEALRGALVVSEIALSLVLLTGAGLLLKSFLRMRAVDPGFRPENVLTVTVDAPASPDLTAARAQALYQLVLQRLSSLPGVTAAGAVNYAPIRGNLMWGTIQAEGGRPVPPDYMPDKPVVMPGYFHALGIRLLRGRDFTERDDAAAPAVIIISRTVAERVWPGEDPIGKRMAGEDTLTKQSWLTVVGVVDDIRQRGLDHDPDSAVYQTYRQVTRPDFLAHLTFVLRTAADPAALGPAVRRALRDIVPNQAVPLIATMPETILETEADPLFQTRLLGVFSILALILATVGIYGVLAYSVAERTREIGIRIALGADMGDVMGMVLRRTLTLAGTGVALGTAGALVATRVLVKFLFGVKPTDPGTFVAVIVLLAAVALLAGWIPARRAIRVDPMVALRYE